MNPAPKIVAPPEMPATQAVRPRVLVADDSRVIRLAIKKILDGDFEVVVAESGDVAWSLLERDQNFQMLVTDIEMPGIDGYELICRVRGSDNAQLKGIPILTITGAEDEQTKERAFACGATDFIIKPIDTIQLKARALSYVRLDQSVRDSAEKVSQLEEQAIADPLTGLRSRRYFMQRGDQDIAYCVRNHKDLTVIRFDVDRFKDIYRKYGDDVGDGILTWLAGVVSANARIEDTVARVAGAKFAILATATGIEEAKHLCQRIRNAIRAKPFEYNGMAIELTLSSGLASLQQDRAQQFEALLDLAEQRVNRTLAEGGDRVCVSVLGDIAPNIEEVVLDLPAPVAHSEPAVPKSVVSTKVAPISASDEPVLGELEIPDLGDVVGELDIPSVEVESRNVPDALAQLISVDKALQMIASGQSKLIEPYLKTLLQQLKPLLDLLARDKDSNRSR